MGPNTWIRFPPAPSACRDAEPANPVPNREREGPERHGSGESSWQAETAHAETACRPRVDRRPDQGPEPSATDDLVTGDVRSHHARDRSVYPARRLHGPSGLAARLRRVSAGRWHVLADPDHALGQR